MLVVAVVVFVVVRYLILLRKHVTEGVWGMRGKFSGRDSRADDSSMSAESGDVAMEVMTVKGGVGTQGGLDRV